MNQSGEEFSDFSASRLRLLELLLQEAEEDFEDPNRIEPKTHTGPIALSFSQQRLWLLHQLYPTSPAYNIPVALRLSGPLNLAALRRSLNAIVERHAILRTTFALVDGRPAQVIMPAEPVQAPLLDLQGWPADQREAEARQLVFHASQQLFDLARGPLFRVRLLRLAADDHVLALTMHHIIFDAWSGSVLLDELAALYNRALAGLPLHLPDLPIQYADYAVWQRAWLHGDRLDALLAYWCAQLAGLSPLAIPTDFPRPPHATFQGAEHVFRLALPRSAELNALRRQHGLTSFMIVLAACYAWLARYTAQTDLVVGATIANRARPETEGLIGCFINTLALRADLRGDPSFHDLLLRTRDLCLAAYAHQDLPFERLVEALHPQRDLSRQPLVQVLFELHALPSTAPALRHLTAHAFLIPRATEKFDLTLAFGETDADLTAVLSYSTALFCAPTIARMARHFQRLLVAALADPQRRLAALPLLSAAERHELLVARNDTTARYPAQRCYPQLVADQVARTPDAIAVVLDRPADPAAAGEPAHLTYQHLEARAGCLADHLLARGVQPGQRVGLCLERTPDLLVGLLAILTAGAVFLPLDPDFPRARLAFMLHDAGAVLLLTHARLRPRLPAEVPTLCLDTDWPGSAPSPAPPARLYPDALAYVIYTSGSTGTPKGVLISHRNLLNYLCWSATTYGVVPGGAAPVQSSIAADAIYPSLFTALLVGGCVVLPSDEALAGLRPALRRYGPFSMIKITPTQLEVLTSRTPPALVRAAVRTLVVGAEALHAEALTVWRSQAPQTCIRNEYGPTETTVGCSSYRLPAGAPQRGPVPIGLPSANTQMYVLDRHMQPTPLGVTGELYIGGAGLAWGYLGRPDLTAAVFVPNPFGDCRLQIADCRSEQSTICNLQSAIGTRLYRTGDLARYLADGAGNIEFLGRADGQIKLRGYRIEPDEIAATLAQHPAVQAATVLLREDAPGARRLVAYVVRRGANSSASRPAAAGAMGRGSLGGARRLVAYIAQGSGARGQGSGDPASETLIPDPRSLIAELRAFLAARLPSYMLPSAIALLAELPLTATGKLDRRALPAPEHLRPDLAQAFVAPRTPTEETLARIWAEILQLERVGVEDNFFELGGHSLLAIQALARADDAFDVRLPLHNLFEAPTIAELAERIETIRWAAYSKQSPASAATDFSEEMEL